MRQLAVFGMFMLAAGIVQADQGGTVKCKADGLHLCCPACDNSVKEILGKIDGVTDVKVDRKAADKVTFAAKSEKTASDALAALVSGGFCCDVTCGDKKLSPVKQTVNITGNEITVKNAHVCCNTCIKAVKALFKDATVTINGTGTQRDIVVSGNNLSGQVVLDTLQKAGFTGTVEGKK